MPRASAATPSPGSSGARDFRFCIDRGGTFTDVYAEVPGAAPGDPPTHRTLKLLSEDPANYESAPREGIRRILQDVTGEVIPRDAPVPTKRIEWIRMGTTVATNALLERTGARTALLVTEGFADLLAIGNQARPDIFDLKIEKPGRLYEEVVEVRERVRVVDDDASAGRADETIVEGVTGERVLVETPLDVESLRPKLQSLLDAGVRSLAVVLMHSYAFPAHENAVGHLARSMGFDRVSLSSALVPMAKIVPRGHTASVDAYLTPCIREYLRVFLSGFDEGLADVKVSFMQSDGGLTPAAKFTGYKAVLSGPAGGVVGYAMTASKDGAGACIGFDMGGTSTDVSRFDGAYEQVTETETAGVTIQAPQLDITTVAAGGGSRLEFRSGTFRVGPESVGSDPGPVCYRKGGVNLAVTDANVVLGRVQPEYFPKIFGPNEDAPLDADAARKAFEAETERINEKLGKLHDDTSAGEGEASTRASFEPLSPEEVALGYVRVANEAMCRPIREITESKGFDAASHVLAAFGGAGPQHACAIARSLGISTVFVHRFCGILSAYGMGLADVVSEAQRPFAETLGNGKGDKKGAVPESVAAVVAELEARVEADLGEQGFERGSIETETLLNLRYDGTDTAMMIPEPSDGDFASAFRARFEREYGFDLAGRDLIVDDVRVRGVGKTELLRRDPIGSNQESSSDEAVEPDTTARVYFEGGWRDTPVFLIDALGAGTTLEGPAVVMNGTATCVIEPGCVATITEYGDLRIDVDVGKEDGENKRRANAAEAVGAVLPTSPDPITLSIFNNRFMGIAEQMGRTLQRTSVSTNIKERLDFSCALFGPEGGLVANAPHVPVHLGAMSSTVRWQIEQWGPEGLRPGDVLVTNHPVAGGSHLPDITVVTPVFRDGEIVFFVASRGHHADVGGITPGSMPPFSRTIADEGAAIKSFKLVDRGTYDEEGIAALLTHPETGSPGTRKLADCLSDLNAQAAANRRGIALIDELIDEFGLGVVQKYMGFVQDNAELAVRDTLRECAGRLIDERNETVVSDTVTVVSSDAMDDGSRIELRLTLDRASGSATFDFTGTSPEVRGNWNAPPAVTSAAVIYCARCLVNQEIPLNQGCLNPIEIIVPDGTLLSPSETAAVVGGNVLTSQRVTDVCLAAFDACADSQGCMNNLTFGDDTFGYYETVGGGAGAGPTWDGASGTQCHMTNTRITDPEILERRYPVALRRFEIRKRSGGSGRRRGGDGIRRVIEFLRPLVVSVLTERRGAFPPRGKRGGGDGAIGKNTLLEVVQDDDGAEGEFADDPLLDRDGRRRRRVDLGGKNSVRVAAGDALEMLTPGGGGFGSDAGEEGTN
jgi:5-oxoprolinase (ATP-hydrolysing)